MIIEKPEIKKYCSFYMSDFHLEMILVPYINQHFHENENVIISTQKNLKDSVNILMSKMNLNQKDKERILELNWNNNQINNIEENANVIIIGNKEFINKENQKLEKMKTKDVKVIDCYDFEEVKDDINKIIKEYDKNLNTIGLNDL